MPNEILIAAFREFEDARSAFKQAQVNFDQAEPDYIDIAINDMRISEKRLDNALKRLRKVAGSKAAAHVTKQSTVSDRYLKLYDFYLSDHVSNKGRRWLEKEMVEMYPALMRNA